MNVVIAILLCIFVYFLASILTVIKEFIKAHIADKNAFDPDYPFYSRDIFLRREESLIEQRNTIKSNQINTTNTMTRIEKKLTK
jgi:hypothetical protein